MSTRHRAYMWKLRPRPYEVSPSAGRPRPRNMSLNKLYDLVKAFILLNRSPCVEYSDGKAAWFGPNREHLRFIPGWVQKEVLAQEFRVPEHQVETVLMRLNREGMVSQAVHRGRHDNEWTRDNYYVEGNYWKYLVDEAKLRYPGMEVLGWKG